MKTEELNEYIFADLIEKRALVLYLQDQNKLEEQETSEKKTLDANFKRIYIAKALAILQVSKKLVFEALGESEKASQQ